MNKNDITVKDLMPNVKILQESEMIEVKKAVFNAVVTLVGKGYNRSEIMEAIYTDCHSSAIESLLKLRIKINKGISPWEE